MGMLDDGAVTLSLLDRRGKRGVALGVTMEGAAALMPVDGKGQGTRCSPGQPR